MIDDLVAGCKAVAVAAGGTAFATAAVADTAYAAVAAATVVGAPAVAAAAVAAAAVAAARDVSLVAGLSCSGHLERECFRLVLTVTSHMSRKDRRRQQPPQLRKRHLSALGAPFQWPEGKW